MSDDRVKKIVDDAASNVACESGEVSKDTLSIIKDYLLNLTKKKSGASDESLIYKLVNEVKHGKRK